MVSKLGGPHFDLVSGVPAAAIPLATCIALKTKIPMILCRKAAKDYGTKKVIEGIWKKGQHCLVVEDVVTYGDSVAETTDLLRANGLIVNHAVVVVERQQGATQNLAANRNVKLHALLTFNDLLMTLLNDGCISEERVQAAKSYNAKWQFNSVRSLRPAASLSDVHFSPDIGQLLFQYMKTKCSRLCLTFDSPAYAEEIISLAERLAPKLCALMLHPELVPDFSPDFTDRLRLLANRKGFLLIADRKLADVGKITRHQLIGGQFRLADWCDLLTVHALTGTDQLAALRKLKQSAQQSTSLSALIVGEIDTESEPHLGDDEAVICPTIGIADRLGYQHVLSISHPDENIIQQMPAPRPRVHLRGLLPRRKAEEGVGQQETVFHTRAQKKEAFIVAATETVGTQHALPGSVVRPDAGIEVTKDN
ncbi:unnamed protein product [Schistocephalus solidus]|uniref:Orotate phosphoribosyltransferase n=1 Tax=Schistocephalus solidus TaxID=70667 RepID=A0A183SEM6_SCHSO|nr:unnamed protein product [Schistocephalus solidus]